MKRTHLQKMSHNKMTNSGQDVLVKNNRRKRMKKIISMLSLILIAVAMNAQEQGSIIGKITDKELNNEALPFANVLIKGTAKGTTTDFDGNYSISNVAPGTYTVSVSFIGYETKDIPNIVVVAGKDTTVNTSLGQNAQALDEVVLTTTVSKESENALLLEQKKAVAIQQNIGAQELAKKGVGNVAAAVTKVSGISKQEGSGSIYVRGLGDRYNATTLNGLPLPSNNPSRKNIDLNIFSTDIVEFIGIDKTYSTSNYGDFAGANIDIVSKNYKGSGFAALKVGIGANTEAISQKDFYLHDGPSAFGFYKKEYPKFPLNNYNFTTSWDREKAGTPINSSFSLKGGDSYTFGEESRLSFFAVAAFDNGYSFKEGVSRGAVNVSGVARKNFGFASYEYKTNTTLMGNIGFRNSGSKIKYNTLYLNSSNQKQQEFTGVIDVFDYAPEGGGFVQRSTFERTSIFINQLLGDHDFNEKLDLNWGVSYNMVANTIPNRRQVVLSPDNWDNPEGPKSFRQSTNTSDNHRYYQELDENEFAANISSTYKFNMDEDDVYRGKITLGYSGRFKNIDFESTQFNLGIRFRDNNGAFIDHPLVDNVYNVDSYFNQENLNKELFTIGTFRGGNNPLAPQTYAGDQKIHAGFVSATYAFSPKFTLIAGLRGEQISQFIEWSTALDVDGNKNTYETFEVLPMLTLKYVLNEKQNLKFAASKTYTLPQYKEKALFLFEDVTQSSFGNPALYASTDYNFDIKWELFPKTGELISLGAFAKYIENPINDITVNSASNDISYVNSGDSAQIIGGEFEVRKELFQNEKESADKILKSNLSVGFNASYMYSTQELDADKVKEETTAAGILPLSVDFSNTEDKLTGASDLLLNADVSFYKDFKKDRNIRATLALNYFSDRAFSLGTEGKGNLVDKGLATLDFIVKTELTKRIALGFTAKNLLNPTVERIQEKQNVVVQSYKKGSNFKLSLSYNF